MKTELKKAYKVFKEIKESRGAKVGPLESDNSVAVHEHGEKTIYSEREIFSEAKSELERKHSDSENFDKKRKHLELLEKKTPATDEV